MPAETCPCLSISPPFDLGLGTDSRFGETPQCAPSFSSLSRKICNHRETCSRFNNSCAGRETCPRLSISPPFDLGLGTDSRFGETPQCAPSFSSLSRKICNHRETCSRFNNSCAGRETRTLMRLPSRDFESRASANSAIPASEKSYSILLGCATDNTISHQCARDPTASLIFLNPSRFRRAINPLFTLFTISGPSKTNPV